MSFAAKLIDQRGGTTRIVNAIEDGKPCWFVLKVDPVRYMDYKEAIKRESVNLFDYGEIINSGWGEDVPDDVVVH